MRQTLLVVFSLVGCGPPNFAGTYAGTIDSETRCDDGTGSARSDVASWRLTEGLGAFEVRVLLGANSLYSCSNSFVARQTGNVLTTPSFFCPAVVGSTGRFQDFVKSGGTLTLNADQLKVAIGLGSNFETTGSGKFQCNATLSGTLFKK